MSLIRVADKKTVWQGRHMSVEKRLVIGRTGREGVWECVHRTRKVADANAPSAIIIFALTTKNEVVMIKNFRIVLGEVGQYSLELPAGLMDKPGATEQEIVEAELHEETGYGLTPASRVVKLMTGTLSAGIISETATQYFVDQVEKISDPEPEEFEDCAPLAVPLENFIQTVLNPPPPCVMADLKSIAPLAIARHLKLIP